MRQERRRRVVTALARTVLVAGTLAATAFYSYRVGVELSHDEIAGLDRRLQAEAAAAAAREDELGRLRAALAASQAEAQRSRAQLAEAPASEDARRLMRMVQERLDRGVASERMARFIAAAAEPRHCGPVAVKKFMVRTAGIGADAALAVRFADRVVVTAAGDPAVDGAGRPEHWFDPAKPVTVNFTTLSGAETVASGTLPMRHSVLAGDRELRFALTPGPRGFIEIAGEDCELAAG